MNILVIGAGLMGSQIACEYAIGGHVVSVASRDPATLSRRIGPPLDLARRLGLTSEPIDDVRRRISAAGSGSGFDLVVEENLLPELSDARDLAGLERRLPTDERALTEARRRRDEGLAAELIDERRSSAAGQAGRDR